MGKCVTLTGTFSVVDENPENPDAVCGVLHADRRAVRN